MLKLAPRRIERPLPASVAACLLACAFALAACSDQRTGPTQAPVRIYLANYLEVAQQDGRVERVDAPSNAAAPGLRQQLDSRITYHFPLPLAAVLSGDGTVQVGADSSSASSARVRVDVVDEDGTSHPILDQRVGNGQPATIRLRADLSESSARMARLDFSLQSFGSLRATDPASGSVALEWQDLRIDGTRSEPAAWPADLRDHYNVLVILMDSLRADRIGPYGDDTTETPRLSRLAEAGVTFANARSNSSWTRPSVATMLTSLQPSAHGILTFDDSLAESLPYLPEILGRAGYRTLAVVNNAMVAAGFGFDRGFDAMSQLYYLRDSEFQAARRDPEVLAEFVWSGYVEPWLREDEHQPFFIYLHELDPHSPYEPPEPYDSLHEFGYQGDADSKLPGLGAMRADPDSVDPEDIRHLDSQYRGEIAFMDRYLGWVLDRLEALDLDRSTLVAVVSDHGEEFWDHGSVGHGHSVYEELLRVPLVMRLEGVLPAGKRVQTDVGLVDVAPTLLDLLGIEIPPRMQGESLLRYIAAPEGYRQDRASFARSNRPRESLSFGRWKLIRTAGQEDPQRVLFDLEDDPREQQDRAAQHPVVVGTLDQMLSWQRREDAQWARVRSSPVVAPADLEPEVLQNLRELGYIE